MNNQPHPYQPVPVDVAAQIAERFSKDIAIILTWDGLHNLVHTTTWGHSANDKLVAADAGETVAKALGCDLKQQRVYEDFRVDAARYKEENDRLRETEGPTVTPPALPHVPSYLACPAYAADLLTPSLVGLGMPE